MKNLLFALAILAVSSILGSAHERAKSFSSSDKDIRTNCAEGIVSPYYSNGNLIGHVCIRSASK